MFLSMKKQLFILFFYFLAFPAIADNNKKAIEISNTMSEKKILEIYSRFGLPPETEDNTSPPMKEDYSVPTLSIPRFACEFLPVLYFNINFSLNSSRLSTENLTKVFRLANTFKHPSLRHCIISVEGHTDSTGSNRYNQILSEKRAQTVYAQLHRLGIPYKRLTSIGYGETHLYDAINPRNAINRRVEFRLADSVNSEIKDIK